MFERYVCVTAYHFKTILLYIKATRSLIKMIIAVTASPSTQITADELDSIWDSTLSNKYCSKESDELEFIVDWELPDEDCSGGSDALDSIVDWFTDV